METSKQKILIRIEEFGPGSVFTAKDFTDLAPRGTVDVTLVRLAKDGKVRRIGRGLYDYPQHSELFNDLRPSDIDKAAQAIARKNCWAIMPHGAIAANMLGLSQQVPAKVIYLSSGPTRKYAIDGFMMTFLHAGPKEMQLKHRVSTLVVQAFRYLGKEHIGEKEIRHLRRILPPEEKQTLLEDTRYGADWIYQATQQIARDSEHE